MIEDNQSERGNLPSASKLERIVACPGSIALENTLPEKEREIIDVPDEQAECGIRIHKARETGNVLELTEEELETYKRGLKFENDLLIAWKDAYGIHRQDEHKEERIWLFDRDLNTLASGRLDVFYLNLPDDALCIDWKSGYATNLVPSARNFQLRLQAVLLWQEYGVKRVRVAFDKPKVKWENTDYCDYSESDLQYALQQIEFYLWQSRQEDAPRRAGAWCRYCPCQAFCREAAAYSMLPSVIAGKALAIESKEDAEKAVAVMTLPDLFKIWSASGVIDKIISAVFKRLKSMTPEQLAEVGLELGPGRDNSKITDVVGAYRFLNEVQKWDAKELWAAMNLSKTAIAKIARKEKNLSSDEKARNWVKAALAEYITPATSEGVLRKL